MLVLLVGCRQGAYVDLMFNKSEVGVTSRATAPGSRLDAYGLVCGVLLFVGEVGQHIAGSACFGSASWPSASPILDWQLLLVVASTVNPNPTQHNVVSPPFPQPLPHCSVALLPPSMHLACCCTCCAGHLLHLCLPACLPHRLLPLRQLNDMCSLPMRTRSTLPACLPHTPHAHMRTHAI